MFLNLFKKKPKNLFLLSNQEMIFWQNRKNASTKSLKQLGIKAPHKVASNINKKLGTNFHFNEGKLIEK